jgi:hypothetical protein
VYGREERTGKKIKSKKETKKRMKENTELTREGIIFYLSDSVLIIHIS